MRTGRVSQHKGFELMLVLKGQVGIRPLTERDWSLLCRSHSRGRIWCSHCDERRADTGQGNEVTGRRVVRTNVTVSD